MIVTTCIDNSYNKLLQYTVMIGRVVTKRGKPFRSVLAPYEREVTVKGKPLKEQQDVAAHGRAVDFIRDLTKVGRLTEEDVLQLHRLTVPVETVDIYRPVGAWKREDNGTYGAEDGRQVYMSYASADDTPALMKAWNRTLDLVAEACK